MTGKLCFETASLTHKGTVRSNNEDNIFALDKKLLGEESFGSIGLYIIADGMGGHRGGEVASKIASQVVSREILDSIEHMKSKDNPIHIIKQSIEKANREIFELAERKSELHSMGTTITIGCRLGSSLYIGHVGDSRAYLIRRRKIVGLTKDHSLVAALVEQGTITLNEAKTHPDRGKILRCLGVSGRVSIDTYFVLNKEHKLGLREQDYLVFCSDGLTNCLTNVEILDCVMRLQNPEIVCRELVDLANFKQSTDNISVIIVRVTASEN